MSTERGSIHVFSEDYRCSGTRHHAFHETPAAASLRPAKKFAGSLKIEKQDLLPEVRMAAPATPGA
jgi:hypothetical protein